jgi:hypothetical protein
LRVQGPGFRVQGSGFRVQGSGFRVQGSELGGAFASARTTLRSAGPRFGRRPASSRARPLSVVELVGRQFCAPLRGPSFLRAKLFGIAPPKRRAARKFSGRHAVGARKTRGRFAQPGAIAGQFSLACPSAERRQDGFARSGAHPSARWAGASRPTDPTSIDLCLTPDCQRTIA